MALGECACIWKEAVWFGPATIEAEPIDVHHPVAASAGSETLLHVAPRSKCCGEVRIPVAFVMKDSVK